MKNFEEIGEIKDNIKEVTDEEMTQNEFQQILLIKILIDSYFNIVKLNIGDSVPKAIMRNLVNNSRENLQRILISKIYNNETVHELLLDENPEIRNRRKECADLKKSLSEAFEILKDVIA